MKTVSETRLIIGFRSPDNRHLTDAAEVERALKMGEYIKNGASSSSWQLNNDQYHEQRRSPCTLYASIDI